MQRGRLLYLQPQKGPWPPALELLSRLQRDRIPAQGTPELRATERRGKLQRGGGVLGGAGREGLTPAEEGIKEGALGIGPGLFAASQQRKGVEGPVHGYDQVPTP